MKGGIRFVLITGLLLAPGCASKAARPAAPGQVSPATTIRRPATDGESASQKQGTSIEEAKALVAEGRPLEIFSPTPAQRIEIEGWIAGDLATCWPKMWKSPFDIREALGRYERYRGEPPPDMLLTGLAPFVFAWPARAPGSSEPIPLIHPVDAAKWQAWTQRAQLTQEEMLDAQAFALELDQDSRRLTVPFRQRALIETYGFITIPLTDSPVRAQVKYQPRSSMQEALPRLERMRDHRRWGELNDVESWLIPDELRLYLAASDIMNLIRVATVNSWQVPGSLSELERYSGHVLLNLEPIDAQHADLVVEFDGEASYLFTLRYPAGVTHTIQYQINRLAWPEWLSSKLDPTGNNNKYQGKNYKPFAAFHLTSSSDAQLPVRRITASHKHEGATDEE